MTQADRWEIAGKLAVPRLTHRLLPGIAGDLLAVGGNFAGAPVRFVDRRCPNIACGLTLPARFLAISLETSARQQGR